MASKTKMAEDFDDGRLFKLFAGFSKACDKIVKYHFPRKKMLSTGIVLFECTEVYNILNQVRNI